MPINIDILNTLIKNQKDAIQYQSIFASIIVILGISLIFLSNFILFSGSSNDNFKTILSIGGGFISTISAYPINQIISRNEKIKTFKIFKLKLNDMNEAEIKKVEELIWKSIEKII